MKLLHPSEVRQLLGAVDMTDPFGPRDHALITFCYHTGLRVSELVALDVHHVAVGTTPRAALHVPSDIGKGRHERTLPLNETARAAVATILAFNARRGFSIAADRPLFVAKKHTRMTVRAVQRLVEALRNKAQLDVPATPHTLRHSHASAVLSCNGNLRIVQQLLGHRRLSTVEIYTHPTRDELAAAVARMHEGGARS